MTRLIPVLALLLLACGGPATAPSPAAVTSPAAEEEGASTAMLALESGAVELSATSCPAASAHVYHPARLALLAGCKLTTLTGTIDAEKPEPDGDVHIRLHLDVGQTCAGQTCISPANTRQQHGDLVLEPVCTHTVTQRDAVSACTGFHNPIVLPKSKAHVQVVGYWVSDRIHGNWRELHPLESVTVLAA